MRIYCVYAPECDYDEYDAFVVRAATEAQAIELVRDRFNGSQGKPAAIDVTDGEEEVILWSFNAG